MIFYFIGSFKGFNSGYGGHYFSLMHIAEAISKKKEVVIVNIGDFAAPVLKLWEGKLFYVKASFFRTENALNKLKQLCLRYRPEIIHAFDKNAGYFARRISHNQKIPWMSTKPGGPNPSHNKNIFSLNKFYSRAQIQTVFHKEDYEWFKSRAFKPTVLEHIPGRVKVIFSQREELQEINSFYANTEVKLIRIARFSEQHYVSMLQSVNFTKKMLEEGINAKLVIIGSLHNVNYYKKLKQVIGNESHIFTSEKFTRKASDFLPLADVAIGAGRSFMEGCAAGCIMMAPVKGAHYPALVRSNNVEYFEAYNFSDRTPPNEYVNPNRDLQKYIYEITSKKDKISKELFNIFQDRYSAEKAADKYIDVYNFAKENKIYENLFFDILLDHIRFKCMQLCARTGFMA